MHMPIVYVEGVHAPTAVVIRPRISRQSSSSSYIQADAASPAILLPVCLCGQEGSMPMVFEIGVV